VVGHELTHGFDDEGSQFDAAGNLKNWWTPEVNEKFKEKGECIANQYSQYAPLKDAPELKVNGKLTEGENIADNGGIKEAYRAYSKTHYWIDERKLEQLLVVHNAHATFCYLYLKGIIVLSLNSPCNITSVLMIFFLAIYCCCWRLISLSLNFAFPCD
jgi:hypothetical protein